MNTHATLSLTGRELDALNTLVCVVLNDPDWFDNDRQELNAVARVSDKVQAVLRLRSKLNT